MECHYINLDQATERRQSLEESFAKHCTPGWSLFRYPAVNVPYIQQHQVSGQLRDSEKACFMSHRRLIGDQIGCDDPVLILEDDARFGVSTFKALDRLLINLPIEFEWDIIFTDIAVIDPKSMIDLVQLRRELTLQDNTRLLDLSKMAFAGATGYLIRPQSIEKIYKLLEAAHPLDIPYDLYLRSLIWRQEIKGHALFPFVTSISEWAESSQIQLDTTSLTDLTWNTFRKLAWIDRDLDQVRPAIQTIDRTLLDEESRYLATIVAAATSSHFILK